MINISIDIKSYFIETIKLSGHAESNEKGKDLICCSISTLTISLINALTEIAKANIKAEVSEGFTLIEIDEQEKNKRLKSDILTKSFMLSVKGIEEENPEFIKLNITEE